MASATHRERQIPGLDKIESPRDIGRTGTAHDQRRAQVECTVEDQARRFIPGGRRRDYVAGNLGSELPDRRRIERSRILFACFDDSARSRKDLNWVPAKRGRGDRRLPDKPSSSIQLLIHSARLSRDGGKRRAGRESKRLPTR